MINMGKFTSIQVTQDLKEQLGKIKDANNYNSYQEAIEQLIKDNTNTNNYTVISREKIAISLRCIQIDEKGNGYLFNEYNVSYFELKNAGLNDLFSPKLCDGEHYLFKTGKVIYKDENFVLLKINEVVNTPDECNEYHELVGIDLF